MKIKQRFFIIIICESLKVSMVQLGWILGGLAPKTTNSLAKNFVKCSHLDQK